METLKLSEVQKTRKFFDENEEFGYVAKPILDAYEIAVKQAITASANSVRYTDDFTYRDKAIRCEVECATLERVLCLFAVFEPWKEYIFGD